MTRQPSTLTTAPESRCGLTELPCAYCAHCLGIPDPPPRELGRPFTAGHDGRCADCGEPYSTGDRICAAGDGYVSSCCEVL